MPNEKGGRPIKANREQFLQMADDIARQEREWRKEQQRRQAIVHRLDEPQIWALLKFFFDGSLLKWDTEDILPQKMTRELRDFFSTTTGKTLVQQASHDLVKEIIDEMAAESVEINGTSWECYKVYALRVHIGDAKPFAEENQYTPIPLPFHIRQAYEQFTVMVHDRILNSK